MTDFEVAIPSYDRAKILKKKTLKMLDENEIDKSIITIFVANDEEKKIYEEHIGTDYKIVIGELGVANIRNFINNYYPSGKKILSCDDDITRIVIGESSGLKVTTVYNLKSIVEQGFKLCNDNNVALFGLHPSNNPRSLKSKNIITTTLKPLTGAMLGFINDKTINTSLNDAEAQERTIKYFIKYGGVIRMNNYTAITTYYAKGGMETAGRTIEKEDIAKKELVKQYPEYAETFTRPNGRTEIKLNSCIPTVPSQ